MGIPHMGLPQVKYGFIFYTISSVIYTHILFYPVGEKNSFNGYIGTNILHKKNYKIYLHQLHRNLLILLLLSRYIL